MSSLNKGRATEVTSPRDLEKEFISIAKLFTGRETEQNWEARDASVRRLRNLLHQSDKVDAWKDTIIAGLQGIMSDMIKTIHSLRSSVATEGLCLIQDIGMTLGDSLNVYTLEIILTNLLKCSSVTKKMIATKAAQVTNAFLANTHFHIKIIMLLCKTINEKNVQLRQYAATYIKTMLETHGSKDIIRSIITEKPEVSQSIESFLRKGLADGSPHVREASRQTYSVYYDYWPDAAEKLLRSLDSSIQRLLEKNSPRSSPKPTSRPRMLSSRSNSMSSASSKTSTSTAATSLSLFKRPYLTKSSSLHTMPKPNTIPATSLEVKRNQQTSRLSHISNVSAPSTTIQHKLSKITTSRRTQSEFHQQSILASASLLHMLKSNDLQMQCKGIHTLSERLRNTAYHPSPTSIMLPPDVPSKIDILPILMDLISRHDLDLRLYQLLMSWESLAGIFVYIMSFNYYCPTLIIADQECRHKTQKEADIMKMYSKGLTRIKMFLKRNDPELPQRLLDIAKSVTEASSVNDIQLLDASVKRDLVLYPQYKESLLYGLFSWMDQLVCDYVGLPEDEDPEILMEGSQWLNVSEKESFAGQWFEDKANIHSFVQFVIKSLLQTQQTPSYDMLSCMASHLKMANERVFESEMKLLSQQHTVVIEKALGIQPMSRLDAWIQQEDFSLLEEQGSTGMTQDISKIRLEFEPSFEEPIVEEEMLFDLEPIMDERSFDSPPPLRDELPPSPILQPSSQEKKRLARSAFELSPERSQPKKRRLSEDREPFLETISLIKQNKADTSTFQHIQQFATASDIWLTSYQQKSLLHVLIESLIDYLEHSQEQPEVLQIQAILTIKSLLTHQSTWIKKEQSLVYQLTRTLVGKQTDNNSNIYSVSESTVDKLFEFMPPDHSLSILWDISKEKDYPLGALFSHISKVAPKSSTTALEHSLQNGAVDILIQGYNHASISVRKSCVLASVGIHRVLGDSYIKNYLSVLRAEQLTLLQHYITKQKNTFL